MTKDLEETIAELGPEYRTVVSRLTAAYEPLPSSIPTKAKPATTRTGRLIGWGIGYLAAASLLIALALSVLFTEPQIRATSEAKLIYTVAYAQDESALKAIVRAQQADGSWANDFLTRQNAAALRNATDLESRIAYKKAVRYLRAKGLNPLSDAELKDRCDKAALALART